MTLRQKSINGVIWNSIGRFSNQILQFILSIILMRLLQPSDFGLIAMAMVFIGFAGIFSEFGFSSAIIQNRFVNELHLSSIFWLNIIVGTIFTFIMFFNAKILAEFYNNDSLIQTIRLLSFTFILSSISIVPNTILQKAMRYDVINKISIVAMIVSGMVSVSLAIRGWGVLALVFQNLVSQLIKTPLMLKAVNWKPKLVFDIKSIKDLFSFSAYLTGFNIINYWSRRSDDLLIGKFIGSDGLGIYSRAYNLMLLPLTQIIGVVSNVMFPALSSIQNDKVRIKRIYLEVVEVISFITFPLMICLIAIAHNFILAVFGSKWAEVIPVIQILAFVGVIQSIGNPVGWIYASLGKTKWMFWWGIFASTITILAIVIGIIIGSIYSVAIAYLITSFLLIYPVIAIPGRLINLTFYELINKIYPILIISLITSSITYLIDATILLNQDVIVRLLSQIFISVTLYLFIMSAFKITTFLKIKNLVVEHLNSVKKTRK